MTSFVFFNALLQSMFVFLHLPNGWVHTSTGGGWEYPLFLCLVSIVIYLQADGVFTLKRSDHFLLN
jgi:putative oxidoreductase